jgi:phage baseplate assembly protein W
MGYICVQEEHLNFPFKIGYQGSVAVTDTDSHIRQEIEQILFTNPGERVNLPEFGCGIRNLVFAGNDPTIATTAQFIISQSLQRWLGDKINVELVNVKNEEETLLVEIIFSRKDTGERSNTSVRVG